MNDDFNLSIGITADTRKAEQSTKELLSKNLTQKIKFDVSDAKRAATDASRELNEALAQKLGRAGAGAGVLAGILAASTAQAKELAQEYTNTQAALELFNKTLERNNIDLQEGGRVAQELSERLKISTTSVQEAITTILRAGGSLEDAQRGIIAAGASAAVAGADIEKAINNASGALATGRSELMEYAGIIVNASDAYKEYAKAAGVSVDALTQEQRVRAYANAVFKESRQEIEDLETAMGSLTGQQSNLKKELSETRHLLGGIVSPAIEGLTNRVYESVKGFNYLLRAVNPAPFYDFLKGVGAVSSQTVEQIGNMTKGIITALYPVGHTLTGILSTISNVGMAVVQTLTTVINALINLIQNDVQTTIKSLKENFKEVVQQIKDIPANLVLSGIKATETALGKKIEEILGDKEAKTLRGWAKPKNTLYGEPKQQKELKDAGNYKAFIKNLGVGHFMESQDFGKNPFKYGYGADGHRGIDIATPIGTPIYAPFDLKNFRAGNEAGGYGKYIAGQGIVNGREIKLILGHLDKIVAQGDTIRKGALLGYTGNTGNSTGAHLHIETRNAKTNQVINPKQIYKLPKQETYKIPEPPKIETPKIPEPPKVTALELPKYTPPKYQEYKHEETSYASQHKALLKESLEITREQLRGKLTDVKEYDEALAAYKKYSDEYLKTLKAINRLEFEIKKEDLGKRRAEALKQSPSYRGQIESDYKKAIEVLNQATKARNSEIYKELKDLKPQKPEQQITLKATEQQAEALRIKSRATKEDFESVLNTLKAPAEIIRLYDERGQEYLKSLKRLNELDFLEKKGAIKKEFEGYLKENPKNAQIINGLKNEQLKALEEAEKAKVSDIYRTYDRRKRQAEEEIERDNTAKAQEAENAASLQAVEELKKALEELKAQALIAIDSQELDEARALIEEYKRLGGDTKSLNKSLSDKIAAIEEEELKRIQQANASLLELEQAFNNIGKTPKPFEQQIKALEELKKNTHANTKAVTVLQNKYKALQTAQIKENNFKETWGEIEKVSQGVAGIFDKLNLGDYKAAILDLTKNTTTLINSVPFDNLQRAYKSLKEVAKDLSFNGLKTGLKNTFKDLFSGLNFGGIFNVFSGFIGSIISIFNRNSKALQVALTKEQEYYKQFKYDDRGYNTYKTIKTPGEWSLFDWFPADTYSEQIDEVKKTLALNLEDGFTNGIKSGFTAALQSGQFSDFGEALKKSLRGAIVNALIDGFLNQEVIKNSIGGLIKGFLKNGDIKQLEAGITDIETKARPLFESLKKLQGPETTEHKRDLFGKLPEIALTVPKFELTLPDKYLNVFETFTASVSVFNTASLALLEASKNISQLKPLGSKNTELRR